MRIKFIVHGKPLPKRRHRSRYVPNRNPAKKGFVMAYKDKTAVAEENLIRTAAIQVKPDKLLTGAIELFIISYFPIPKSTSKKKRALMLADEIRPLKKPDLSNILKNIEDACNEIIWVDDSHIVDLITRKFYSETPRTEIIIEEILFVNNLTRKARNFFGQLNQYK